MKRETLAKRINKLNINHCSVAYQVLAELAGIKNFYRIRANNIVRPTWYSGYGRFAKTFDYSLDIRAALTACKIKYVEGNDAPRGGKSGNYIKILTKITD